MTTTSETSAPEYFRPEPCPAWCSGHTDSPVPECEHFGQDIEIVFSRGVPRGASVLPDGEDVPSQLGVYLARPFGEAGRTTLHINADDFTPNTPMRPGEARALAMVLLHLADTADADR